MGKQSLHSQWATVTKRFKKAGQKQEPAPEMESLAQVNGADKGARRECFDWVLYCGLNADLVAHGITDEKKALLHYEKHGKQEGRIATLSLWLKGLGFEKSCFSPDFSLELFAGLNDIKLLEAAKAIEKFFKAEKPAIIKVSPDNSENSQFFLELGKHYDVAGKPEKAYSCYMYSTYFQANGAALEYLGNILFSRGDYEGAVNLYKAALRTDKSLKWCYKGLTDSYVNLGKYDDAVSSILEGLKRIADFKQLDYSFNRIIDQYWRNKEPALTALCIGGIREQLLAETDETIDFFSETYRKRALLFSRPLRVNINPRRVLIIGDFGLPQCRRYRIYQKVEQLAAAGYQVTAMPWIDSQQALAEQELYKGYVVFKGKSKRLQKQHGLSDKAREKLFYFLQQRLQGQKDISADADEYAFQQRLQGRKDISADADELADELINEFADELKDDLADELAHDHAVFLHDIIIFYRVPAFPHIVKLIAQARALGKLTFYEIDDLLFDPIYPPPLESYGGYVKADDYIGLLKGMALNRAAARLCQYGIASTQPLVEKLGELVESGQCYLHRNGLDANIPSRPPRMQEDKEYINIFYGSGTQAHNVDFIAEVLPALDKILAVNVHVRLTIVGYLQLPGWFLQKYPEQVLIKPFVELAKYWNYLAQADINIAVLLEDEINHCKSELKWFEAACFGIPSVVSRTRNYLDVIRHGEDGFIVSGANEWFAVLRQLVDSAELRLRMGEAAMLRVKEEYSIPALAKNIRQVIDLAMSDIAKTDGRRMNTIETENMMVMSSLDNADLEQITAGESHDDR